jgi:hypothetical protein
MKIRHLKDIWDSYCLSLMASNNGWIGIKDWDALKSPYYSMYRKCVIDDKPRIIEAINYKTFSAVITSVLDKAKDSIIKGERLILPGGMGNIVGRRVERDFSKKSIDFKSTAKVPKVWSEEKQRMTPSKIIFYTENDWCRIGWGKPSIIKNISVYEFKPTRNLRSGKGFNQMFSSALIANPALKYKYVYFPLPSKIKQNDI